MSNIRSATKTLTLMIALTLISKVLGFIREMVMANFYGTSYVVDAYVMASAIPNILLGGIFAAVATTYIPIFSQINEKEGEEKSNRFTSQIINMMLMLSLLAALCGFIFSDQITKLLAGGFTGETAELTSFYVKVSFSYIIFTSVAVILDAFMQYKGHFLKPIISGYFFNFGVITFILISTITSHHYIAFGAFFGGLFRIIYILYNTRNAGFRYTKSLSLTEPVKRILSLAIPVFIGSYILQLNSLVDRTLASRLSEGSVAALNYGMILITLITGLTVTLLVTLIYPKITKACTLENWNEFNRLIEKGTNLIAMITIPFTFGIIAFGNEVVQVIYERGAFDPAATDLTAGAFLFYGLGLVFYAFNDLLTRVYYSMRNTKLPIICSGISVAINIIFNLLLIDSMGHRGLALSTSIAAIVNTCMLYILMRRYYSNVRVAQSWRKILIIILSASVAVFTAYSINNLLIQAIWLPRIIYLLISIISAICCYLVILKIFKVEEISEIKHFINKRRVG